MIESAAQLGEALVIGLSAGILYASVGFTSNQKRKNETFDPIHWGSSVIVACGAALSLTLVGIAPTDARLESQLAVYGGLTYAVERTIRSFVPIETQRRLRDWANFNHPNDLGPPDETDAEQTDAEQRQ